MKEYLAIFLFSLISTVAFARDDYEAFAREAQKHIPEQIEAYRQDAEQAKLAEKKIGKGYQNDAREAERKAREILNAYEKSSDKSDTNRKRMPSILIFVSFSMPEKSLEAYLHDAKKIHASIVVRGLIDNSFQKTFQRIAELIKTSGGEGIELNPLWFKRFGIHTVPAVVIVPDDSACFKNEICNNKTDPVLKHDGTSFDVMTGDITLSAALKMIRDRGQSTQSIAQDAINKLQGSSHA